jgi:hypothetical protein
VVHKGDKLPLSRRRPHRRHADTRSVPAKLRLTRIDWQNSRASPTRTAPVSIEPIFGPIIERDVIAQAAENREHKWTIAQPQDAASSLANLGSIWKRSRRTQPGAMANEHDLLRHRRERDRMELSQRIPDRAGG